MTGAGSTIANAVQSNGFAASFMRLKLWRKEGRLPGGGRKQDGDQTTGELTRLRLVVVYFKGMLT